MGRIFFTMFLILHVMLMLLMNPDNQPNTIVLQIVRNSLRRYKKLIIKCSKRPYLIMNKRWKWKKKAHMNHLVWLSS